MGGAKLAKFAKNISRPENVGRGNFGGKKVAKKKSKIEQVQRTREDYFEGSI